MASLIQLKQIESSSALIAAAEVGADFSQSVIDIVTTNIQAVLPEGVISSSAQIVYADITGIPAGIVSSSDQLTQSFDERYELQGRGVVSSSAQIIELMPEGVISSSAQVIELMPEGVISSSAQVTYSDITGIPQGIISGASQLDGVTLKNITITTDNADMYSLIISGAIGVVDATNLSGSLDGDEDTTVPAQIYLTGQPLPIDPAVSGSSESNIIDQGEW